MVLLYTQLVIIYVLVLVEIYFIISRIEMLVVVMDYLINLMVMLQIIANFVLKVNQKQINSDFVVKVKNDVEVNIYLVLLINKIIRIIDFDFNMIISLYLEIIIVVIVMNFELELLILENLVNKISEVVSNYYNYLINKLVNQIIS